MGPGSALAKGSGGLLVAGRGLGRRENNNRAARLFNRRPRRLRGAPDRKRNLDLDLARAQQPHAILFSAQHASLDQGSSIDRGRGIELAGIDGCLHVAEIDLVQPLRERGVLEAALGQPAMQRHLAALEALDAHARTRSLTLAAAAAGLAAARADATTDAVALLARARPVGDLVELHIVLTRSFPFRPAP